MPELAFGFSFADLYTPEGLERLDRCFCAQLAERDGALAERLGAARGAGGAIGKKEESELLLALAPHLEQFLARLFGIEAESARLKERHDELGPLYEVKRTFVQRQAAKKIKPSEAAQYDGAALRGQLALHLGEDFDEIAFARQVLVWERDRERHRAALDLALRYAAWALFTEAGRSRHSGGILFQQPLKLDYEHLIRPLQSDAREGFVRHRIEPSHLRRREGFKLTDPGTDLKGALDQANYCIWCHYQGKDSCSTGLREKTKEGQAPFKQSPFATELAGCPLEEKISEMHVLKSQGASLGALAVAIVDNPMLAATGHRICNDCMKSCIFQKQDPVNIPQVETRVLKDVLELPWGFEIYSLLTRWNPLNLGRPLPRAASGRKVLVVGLGPAGFTLAHHLLNEGHAVVAVDGLKIEPLPAGLSGITPLGERVPFRPIKDVRELYEALDARVMAGFGGVAEYGITVRWDKNFLKVIRLLLERRSEFLMLGGVRFGGTLTLNEAFALGFDHIAIAAGAGKPTVLDIPNALARGARAASDFLMALQLTGAAKADSVANLQIRLPVVVVGGGLTAIDTATESMAYYPMQVEKFLSRYEVLVAERGEEHVRRNWSEEDAEIAEEFLAHARALRQERAAAAREGRDARINDLVRSWGGATIAYRRRLIDSPSYTLNHEEVGKAFEEGIGFAEGLTPARIEVDRFGHVKAVVFKKLERAADGRWSEQGEVTLEARSVLIAAGTQPNTILAREDPEHFRLDGRYFRACDETGRPVTPGRSAKPKPVHILLSKEADGRFVSFFGDVHPSFYGNVVKAMGSARQGYPIVSRLLAARAPHVKEPTAEFFAKLNDAYRACVHEVVRLTPSIIEVVLRAPAAARRFRPGQFFRLQNYEANARRIENTTLAMEGLAMTGARVDPVAGLLSIIALEMGGSSDLCTLLKPGEPVVLMGPTGTPTEIPRGQAVLLVGGGLGNAVLFSIGRALRAAGSRVLYFAGYRRRRDRYKIDEIEAASDAIVWACEEAPGFAPARAQDKAFVGTVVRAIEAYAKGELGRQPVPLAAVERLIVIGSDKMMAAVAAARHAELAPYLKASHVAIGSINSPMQCMMKEICAQCLQPHVDPQSGARSYVFSCYNQDQPLDRVDWRALSDRLKQNALQENLTAQWIDRCLVELRVRQMVA
jgi:NADPH-dependent glutamate synthase beta subunit-like oxidoreductase/NAD(P)H-flavin reductase